jgi:ubiquinone/menaquinone biosynthesis C-methylase UbiE
MRKTAQFVVDAVPDMKNMNVRKVLDLGCGGGRHSILLAKSGLEVLGMDISKHALKMARTWIRREKLRDVALVCATMTKLPLSDCCLDAVVSVSVVHHALKKDIVATVNEVYRTIRENGLFLANLASVNDPRFGSGQMVEENTFWVQEAFEDKLFWELHHFFTETDVLDLLHRFREKKVTQMGEKPNYWNMRARK